MRQRIRDIIFLIFGVSLTIIFFTIVIPFLAIIGLIRVISTIRYFKIRHKYARVNT